MDIEGIVTALKNYITAELLDGQGSDLELTTPLLELGIIDSISTLRIVQFMESKFDIEVPANELKAENMSSINNMSKMILKLKH